MCKGNQCSRVLCDVAQTCSLLSTFRAANFSLWATDWWRAWEANRRLQALQVCNAAEFGAAPGGEKHPEHYTPGRLQVCDTADYKSALHRRGEAALSGAGTRASRCASRTHRWVPLAFIL